MLMSAKPIGWSNMSIRPRPSLGIAVFAVFHAAVWMSQAHAAGIVLLPPNGGYDSQIGGHYTPPPGVMSVSRDRLSPPAPGLYSICYFNAFQTQAEETGWWTMHHEQLLLRDQSGKLVEDPDWRGEFFLDTSTDEKRQAIFAIVGQWVRKCADDGFSAIEPDNLDSWTRSNGVLTLEHNLAMIRLLSDLAHELGLAVAQKNNVELGAEGKALGGFDFAIAEECEMYNECEEYRAVYDQVIEIEYADNDPAVFARACAARGGKHPIVQRDRNLSTPDSPDYRFSMC
jgi:hypothetical protein